MENAGNIAYLFFSKTVSLGRICVTISAALMTLCCIYALTDAQIVAQGAELPAEIISLAPESDNEFDLVELRTINRDIIGWLSIDNTDINYPVLQGRDNDFYLARNYRREWATAGSVFLDYRNSNDLSDDLTVIYGHRMSHGKMFSDVTKFVDEKYFDVHQTGEIYIGDIKHSLVLVAFARVPAVEHVIYDVAKSKNDGRAAQLVYELSMWRRGGYDDSKYILLSKNSFAKGSINS